MAAEEREGRDAGSNPPDEEHSSHPVSGAVGAAGGAVAGAAVGALGGPVGMAAGGVAGAVLGGMAGSSAGKGIDTMAAEPPPHVVVDTVQGLVECCKGVEHGMRAWSARAHRHDLKALLLQRAEGMRAAAHELASLLDQGAVRVPDDHGDAAGSTLRGSMSTEGALSHTDDAAVLNECEHALDDAVVRYRKALEQPLPDGIRQVVQRQCDELLRHHDEIRALRDQPQP